MSRKQLTSAQRRLVELNIDLAHFLAGEAWRKNTQSMDLEDVVAVAYEGLVTAAARFDPSRANVVDGEADVTGAFSGYARQRINGAILDWQRARDHVPRRQRSTYKALQELGHGKGRTVEELSELTGLSENKIRLLVAAVETTTVSLTRDTDAPEFTPNGDHDVESHVRVEDTVVERTIRASVVEAFDALPQDQQVIIALRYYEGHDLTRISSMLGLRVSSVRSSHSEALLALHAAMLKQVS